MVRFLLHQTLVKTNSFGFFWRIRGYQKSFRNYLTFSNVKRSGRFFFKILWPSENVLTLMSIQDFAEILELNDL